MPWPERSFRALLFVSAEERMEEMMERGDVEVYDASFGLLCLMSAASATISGLVMLIFG